MVRSCIERLAKAANNLIVFDVDISAALPRAPHVHTMQYVLPTVARHGCHANHRTGFAQRHDVASAACFCSAGPAAYLVAPACGAHRVCVAGRLARIVCRMSRRCRYAPAEQRWEVASGGRLGTHALLRLPRMALHPLALLTSRALVDLHKVCTRFVF